MIEETKLHKNSRTSRNSQNSKGTELQNKQEVSAFEKNLRQILPRRSDKSVSEEELFSALIANRLSNVVDPSIASKYQQRLKEINREAKKSSADREFSYEKTALKALKEISRSEGLSAEQSNNVYSQAFTAANLDDIKDSLYDHKAGKADPTQANASFDKAIRKANRAVAAIENGLGYTIRSLAEARPTGKNVPALGKIGDPTDILA
jgi:C-terminal processing protease CtpA/Prc